MESNIITVDLDKLYQNYLTKVGLKESEMNPVQRIETKRAFMAGCRLLLVFISNELSVMETPKAVEVMDGMLKQSGEFFFNQYNNFN